MLMWFHNHQIPSINRYLKFLSGSPEDWEPALFGRHIICPLHSSQCPFRTHITVLLAFAFLHFLLLIFAFLLTSPSSHLSLSVLFTVLPSLSSLLNGLLLQYPPHTYFTSICISLSVWMCVSFCFLFQYQFLKLKFFTLCHCPEFCLSEVKKDGIKKNFSKLLIMHPFMLFLNSFIFIFHIPLVCFLKASSEEDE